MDFPLRAEHIYGGVESDKLVLEPTPLDDLARGRTRQGRPPVTLNFKPYGFLYEAGYSPLELLFAHNPILTTIIETLTTPALLCLYCTSRTTRFYLHSQKRFFLNLFLVSDEEGERWTELKGRKDVLKVLDEGFPWKIAVDDFAELRRVRITRNERKLLLAVFLYPFIKDSPRLTRMFIGTDIGTAQVQSLKGKRINPKYIPSFMSRHLYWMLQSIPVGRGLTTLVLDGTSIETEYTKSLLPQIEGTLRGLSVKNCKNLECFTWSEWLLEALEQSRPIALQWLHIWGSGNTPTTDFHFARQPEPLEPLEPHKDDPPHEDLPSPEEWVPKASLFANVIPLRFHLLNTLKLIASMSLSNNDRVLNINQTLRTLQLQYRDFKRKKKNNPSLAWFAPVFPLGEPHALIAFMAVAKFLSIKTDIALCVCRQNCYSFVYGRPHLSENRTRHGDGSRTARILVVNQQTGRVVPYSLPVPEGDSSPLHTHCVAEIGARRNEGGTVCQNCGLWEDELSPEDFRGEGEIKEYGGIQFGPAVGMGRIALGSCCKDCVREMTCAGCNSFFCPSCVFITHTNPLIAPINPLAADPPSLKHLNWTCPQSRHGPFCKECEDSEKSHMTCIDCHGSICYGCHGPSGTTISSSLYTKDGWTPEMEEERFGVVGRIDEWEVGAYMGWGGVGEPESTPADLQAQYSSDKSTQARDANSDFKFKGFNNIAKHAPSTFVPEIFRGKYQPMSSYSNVMSDVLASLNSNTKSSSPSKSEYTPATNPLPGTHQAKPDEYGDPFRRICETRIWEQCARCGIGTCAGCLGYEEDLYEPGNPKYIIQEPEYRSCYAGCGKRFCVSCINRPTHGPGELVCGAIWALDKDSEYQIDEFLYRGVTDVPGNEANGGKGGKGVRCGAVLCAECQESEMLIRPTIVQGPGEVEVADEDEREGVETERRQNDRRGVWICVRCELGIRPENM